MTNYDYLYHKEDYGELLGIKHRTERELSWRCYANAAVLPYRPQDMVGGGMLEGTFGGGMLDEKGNYIDGSGLHREIGTGYDIANKTVDECDETIVFLGLWACLWGHELTDDLRRLWVLDNKSFMEQYGRLRFVYVSIDDKEPDKSFLELLEIIGIESVRLERINRITRFSHVILPDECFWRQGRAYYFTKEYVDIIDRVRDHGEAHFVPGGSPKVYYTHRTVSGYRELGERKLEQFFKQQGFTIVSPEKYTLREQINILLNCREFASTCGSASHNSIFLRDHTKVFLIPRTFGIPGYQFALDEVHELDITYVDASLSMYIDPAHFWNGPFYYIVSRELAACFGTDLPAGENRIDFEVYRRLAFVLNRISEPVDYYKDVYRQYLPYDPGIKKHREGLCFKLCCKLRIQKIMALMLKILRA